MISALSVSSVAKLPKCIFLDEGGYRICIDRGGVKLRAFIPFNRANALDEAVRVRDRFLIAAGPTLPKLVKAYTPASRRVSNTGFPGISETCKWTGSTRMDCFCVYLGKKHKPQMKRIYYGAFRSREVALNIAIAMRARVTGENSKFQIPSSKGVAHA